LENGLTVAASNFYQQLQTDSRDFTDTHLSNVLLDSFFTTLKFHQKVFLSQKKQVLQLELLLTTSFFKYARKMYGGITKESKSLE
ncbi:MAG: murein L,D-transpeptidase, partial [Deinococcales bacterium]|nr:murein L,D-transpeptidase [Chitinophagaceae bacterium]